MPAKLVKEFLDSKNVKYVTIKHSKAYTAQEIAASAHIDGKHLAKTVILKVDGKLVFAILPSSYKIDFNMLQDALNTSNVRLATEQEFKDKCLGCEVGAMPPFGNLFNVETYVAASLVEDEDISFNSGTHTELIRMSYRDFEKLVNPKVLRFAAKYRV